jgi:hypothetical protein
MSEVFKGSTRYPTNAVVQMDQGEYLKNDKLYKDFVDTRTDMSYCCEILKKYRDYHLFEALAWIKYNFDRLGGF